MHRLCHCCNGTGTGNATHDQAASFPYIRASLLAIGMVRFRSRVYYTYSKKPVRSPEPQPADACECHVFGSLRGGVGDGVSDIVTAGHAI